MYARTFGQPNLLFGVALLCCHVGIGCSAAGEHTVFTSASGGTQDNASGGAGGKDHVASATTGAGNASGGTDVVLGTATEGSSKDSGSCVPNSCHPAGGDYCGLVGDGCGSKMDCGNCPDPDWVCRAGLCRGGPSCVPRTSCSEGAATYCGKIGDGCGGELDCGKCTLPEICGGNGTPNLCADPDCKPMSCTLPVGQYCGVVGDGCGRSMDCGDCPGGAECGGDGVPGICPGSTGGVGCTGIKCNVAKCEGGGTTSLSGVVYDPAGANPLYNVTVYVPNAPLDPIPTGATCEPCNAILSGQPITTALTDAKGHFRLEGVPTGSDIPLVMQVGRWRRQVTIPKVDKCQETVVNNPQLLRLPRNKSEGNIPHIAITTGERDALECLIPRIGVDRAEVTTNSGEGRIHLYAGGNPVADAGAGTKADGGMGGLGGLGGLRGGTGRGATSMTPGGNLPYAGTLWGSKEKLRGYDIVLYSCEGGEALPSKDPYLANFQDYVDNGGRAFLSHYHYTWVSHGSAALKGTASYIGDDTATLTQDEGVTGKINTSFPKGAALADWLVAVGASTTRGQLTIYESKHSVDTVNPPTQDWIFLPGSPQQTQYLTFNTPVGASADQQCGRVVFTDLHIGASVAGPPKQGGDTSSETVAYPGGCSSNPMSPQIKALEFIFFDLAACVTPDEDTPIPPAPPPATVAPPAAVPVVPPPPPPVPQ